MEFSGLEKLSLLDFDDNITATLFSAGCNMRCPFCHNSSLVLDPLKAPKIPWSEIMEFLEKRKNVLDAVCVSGGEATLMPDLLDKLADIKSLGYKIKLDTNGTNPDVLKDLYDNKLINFVAMDIKNSEEVYSTTCGCNVININKIKQSINLIINSKIPYEFRTTLVKEFHTTDSINGIGKLINGAEKLYIQKFIDRDGVIQKGLHAISKEEALKFKTILNKYVKICEMRGY